jgi:hypothetical protein
MAQKMTVELQDDLDARPADETVRFGVDGAAYEVDLSSDNAAAFRASSHRSSIMPAIMVAPLAASRGRASGRGPIFSSHPGR